MAAQAAVSAGAGLVTVATHPLNVTALHVRTPEAMVVDWQNEQQLLAQMAKSSIILLGPGMGTDDFSVGLVRWVMHQVTAQQTLIVDASALTIMADHHIAFPNQGFIIATPHQGEWAKLSSVMITYQSSMDLNDLQRQNLNIDVLVLKQHHTVVLSQNRQVALKIGGPYQAIGGMGDTLSGMIAGFVAQFAEPRRATEAAVYAHSAIAQELAEHNWVVKPTIIADYLPNFMSRIQNNLVD
ncbi:ADP/ATP-dependent (S)-NAD(P)H-hydrate dehydratase [Weissella diestrammenae]